MLKFIVNGCKRVVNSEFKTVIVKGLFIIGASAVFPTIQGGIEKHVSTYGKMEDTVLVYSRSIGRTFNYFDSVVINGYNLHQLRIRQDADSKISKYENIVNNKFEKMMEIDPAYDVACTMVQIHFDGHAFQQSKAFCDKFKSFIEKDWWLSENLDEYNRAREQLVQEYKVVHEGLAEELKIRRSTRAFW